MTKQVGTKNGRAKLTEDQVRRMVYLDKQGHSYRGIGRIMKLSPSTVSDVISCRTWKHLNLGRKNENELK